MEGEGWRVEETGGRKREGRRREEGNREREDRGKVRGRQVGSSGGNDGKRGERPRVLG